MDRVKGKVAVVTGAARGQGRSHAVQLAAEGADVIITDICAPLEHVVYPHSTLEDLEETAALVEKTGRRAYIGVADVRDREQLKKVVDEGVAEFGRLDIVVANACIATIQPWDQVTSELWDHTIGVGLTGVWNTVSLTAPYLVKARSGSIILISSTAGIKVAGGLVPYSAAKTGVLGLMRAMASELAKDNVRVNAICPGPVYSGMTADGSLGASMADFFAHQPSQATRHNTMIEVNGPDSSNFIQESDASSGIGLMDPREISNAVLYLGSDESRYVTALAMTVDAGEAYT